MNESTPRTTPALSWITLGLVVASTLVFMQLWPPLVLAVWTAGLTKPMLERFQRSLHGRHRAAAALSLMLFVVVALPLGLLVVGVVAGAKEALATVQASSSARSALEGLLSSPNTPTALPSSLADVTNLVKRSGTQGFELLSTVAGAAAAALVGLFLYFGGAYALLVDGGRLWRWVQRNSPLSTKASQRFGAAFHETGRGLLIGVGLTSLVQGLVATIIYASLGVPRSWVLGPITGLASVIPFVGTAIVWAPIALGLFLTGRPGRGVLLLVLGVAVIGAVDNLLRPIFSRWGALQMPMFLVFISVFGGLAAFGTWGALLGPLVVRLTMEALALAREGVERPGDSIDSPEQPAGRQ
jgi:predicted PurR-regulated permease PerM